MALDAENPLAGLVRLREPDLTPERVLVMEQEWWLIYGGGLGQLGQLAQGALTVLDVEGPYRAGMRLMRALAALGTSSPANHALAVIPEIKTAIEETLLAEPPDPEAVRALFMALMKLGHIRPPE